MVEYKVQQDTMSTDDLMKFLVAELQMNVGMNEADAKQEADALINGRRKVRDGEYSVFETFDGEGNTIFYVYERKNNMWELDESKTTNDNVTLQSYFCTSQNKCLSVNEECLSTDSIRKSLDRSITTELVKTIMEEHITSTDDIKRSITKAYNYDFKFIHPFNIIFK